MADDRIAFELDRLVAYDDASVLAEVRRVADVVEDQPLTKRAFSKVSRVSAATCVKRFGSWAKTLEVAGIPERYGGQRVSDKMRAQSARTLTDDEVCSELRRIAALVGSNMITIDDVDQYSDLIGLRVVRNRFGSWSAALAAAGLEPVSRGRRWTDDDYFENMLEVWTHYGRPPRYAEMDRPPSRISSGGYAKRFGTFGRAKQAFVDRVATDLEAVDVQDSRNALSRSPARAQTPGLTPAEDVRSIPLGLRYKVLRRDRFRCVTCGRSPATHLDCVLHADHVVPFARGGKTNEDNLRTLCNECNLGKGDRPA